MMKIGILESRKDMVTSVVGPLLKVREVARLLHVHSNTVRRWSDRGLIRTYRISRRGDRRFRREDIIRFLVQHRVQTSSPKIGDLVRR